MKGRLFVFLVLFLFLPSIGMSSSLSVEELQSQAFANIKRAQLVLAYAQKIIEERPSRESAQLCTELYLEAAQLYGHASRLLKAIGPQYVPQGIVDEFAQGERYCLKVVDELRRMLNKGEVVGREQDAWRLFLQE